MEGTLVEDRIEGMGWSLIVGMVILCMWGYLLLQIFFQFDETFAIREKLLDCRVSIIHFLIIFGITVEF